YQLQTAKTLAHADTTIIVMSGNFTQRGDVAIIDKYFRTKMALAQGADLVLELPTTFALASSGYFCQGAVLTLAACGIDTLSFGSESCNLSNMQKISALLADEPQEYQQILKTYLKKGNSFPKAQSLALEEYLQFSFTTEENPNDVLGIGYLTTIEKYHLPITPIAIPRRGSHSNHNNHTNDGYLNATSIRELVLNKKDITPYVPTDTHSILAHAFADGYTPLSLNDFSSAIFTLLYHQTPETLATLPDMNEELANRLLKQLPLANNISTLLQNTKSKNYTLTRLQRILCYLLLHFTQEDMIKEPLYLRVLGFNEHGQKYLHTLKKNTSLPIITNPAQAKSILSPRAYRQFSIDLRASAIYTAAQKHRKTDFIKEEFARYPIFSSTMQS
ncbi:MAG: nucleotidyltransferase family protein, partial [Clostridia bacterium]|nr:nucleotidyltransferase family protein [Clostridia bacterium]